MENLAEDSYDEQRVIYYGGFWRRLGAQFLDGILLIVIVYPLAWYDLTTLKVYPLFIVSSLIGGLYKPLMEYQYGATLGKMAFRLKCVNADYEKIDLNQALSRNLAFLLPNIITIVLNYFVFTDPDFVDVRTMAEVGKFLHRFAAITWINNFFYLFFIVDAIILGSDMRKRSLHDRWANTFVIYTPAE